MQLSSHPASSAAPLSLPDEQLSQTPPIFRMRRQHLVRQIRPAWKLTLLGRCVALVVGEMMANAALWVAAGIIFGRSSEGRGVLSLCVVAWTLGLRHGLDMDHIVAIDNVTRNLVSMGQLPVTVGLFFSLGHSSIVLGMTIAIIIAVSNIDKLPDISNIGGVIGVCVSASFLFILAVINSVVLWQSIRLARRRRQAKLLLATEAADLVPVAPSSPDALSPVDEDRSIAKKAFDGEADTTARSERRDEIVPGLPATTCIARIGRPIFRLIDRSWKMYPVGVLFGFGFDTASEISLLGVSALAKGTHHIPSGQIILLPLLFTAGMTAVDSLDNIFMLSAYTIPQRSQTGFGDEKERREARWWDMRRWQLFERRKEEGEVDEDEAEDRARMLPMPDQDKLLSISVVLTVISIVVAFLISLTEFMGLALEKCASCSDAAENDPGLSGNWWRFWAAINDNSGYLGAGVIALFVLTFGTWGVLHWWSKRKERRRGE